MYHYSGSSSETWSWSKVYILLTPFLCFVYFKALVSYDYVYRVFLGDKYLCTLLRYLNLMERVNWLSRNEEDISNSQCPKQVELRWQTEVSSSIYATPLITDINRYDLNIHLSGKFQFIPVFISRVSIS